MQEKETITANALQVQKEAIREYAVTDLRTYDPLVYCGTFHKYNEGSIFGAWLCLTDFADYGEFIEVCKQIHADEEDPELMFQDFQGIPDGWLKGESLNEELFDLISAYAYMDCDEQEAFEAFVRATGRKSIGDFHERYVGAFEDEEDFGRTILSECYSDVQSNLGTLECYFDYKAYGKDLLRFDYVYEDGYVFRY